MYYKTIGLGDKYHFGVEIEFGSAQLLTVYSALLSKDVPITYAIKHKRGLPKYEKWYLDIDQSVSNLSDDAIFGGELSSRVLTDFPDEWKELQDVCTTLKSLGAVPSERTSTHITVDVAKYADDPVFFEILSKILAVYETDITLFMMGERFLLRDTKENFAKGVALRLQDTISQVDFSDDDFFASLLKSTDCFHKYDGVSLQKVKSRGLMEFRYPNGTFQEDIIQNNVRFILKLLKAIEEGRFDISQLDGQIKDRQGDIFEKFRILNYIDDSYLFEELTQTISDDSEEYNSFQKQYQNVLKTR